MLGVDSIYGDVLIHLRECYCVKTRLHTKGLVQSILTQRGTGNMEQGGGDSGVSWIRWNDEISLTVQYEM